MKHFTKAFIIFLFIFSASCGDKDGVKPALSDGLGYDVEYTDETLLIEDASSILALDTITQTYTFDATKFQKEPKQGEVILVAGKIMRKVSSVQKNGNNYIIQTEDAALTDAIKNATIAWDITPEWENVSSIRMGGRKVSGPEGLAANGIEFTISKGGIDHKVSIEPTLADGKISSCNFKMQMVKKVGGSATVAFTAEGTAKLPSQKITITIKNGKLQTFKANNKGISSKIKLTLAAAGGKSGEHSLKMPGVALSIPIHFIPTPSGPIPLPIPMSTDIGIQFVSKLHIPDIQSSATAESKLSISTDAGLEYKGTTVETSAKIEKDEITDGTFDSAANLGQPIDVQFGIAFPRIGLNIVGQEVAYVHTGFTTGSSLYWGPLCKSGYVKFLVEGGYSLKALGQTIAEDKKIFAESQKEAKSENCK
ncbi:MAG: hypothetical protein ACJARG_000423 [Arcticibacterium sp.]|jgi:hypothetical protein